jgi:nucleotide-binding universal stress UspA family protein
MTFKVLLPVDGSDSALRAVDHLIAHVTWFREVPEIHVLHVHPPIPVGRVQAHVGKETLLAYYLEDSESQLKVSKEKLEAAGYAYTPHVHVGQPAEVIARVADALGCDLIIMGSHGRSGLAGLLMGSVASRVQHLAHCPVLLVK